MRPTWLIAIGVLTLAATASAAPGQAPRPSPTTVRQSAARFVRPYKEAFGPLFSREVWKKAPWLNLVEPLSVGAATQITLSSRDWTVGTAAATYLLQHASHLSRHSPVLRHALAKWLERNWKGSLQVIVLGALLMPRLTFGMEYHDGFQNLFPETADGWAKLFGQAIWEQLEPAIPVMAVRATALLHGSVCQAAAEERLASRIDADIGGRDDEFVCDIEEVARRQRADARSMLLVRGIRGLSKLDTRRAYERLHRAAQVATPKVTDKSRAGELYRAVADGAERLSQHGDSAGLRRLATALLPEPL